MKDRRLHNILILSIFFGAVAVFASMFVSGGRHATGVCAGAIIGPLNFLFLAMMIEKMLGQSPTRAGLMLRFLFKYGLVALLIAVAVFGFRVSPLGLAVGFSATVLAIFIGPLTGGRASGD